MEALKTVPERTAPIGRPRAWRPVLRPGRAVCTKALRRCPLRLLAELPSRGPQDLPGTEPTPPMLLAEEQLTKAASEGALC